MFGITRSRIIALLVIAAVFYGAIQYAQVYFCAVEFDDFIKSEVKFAPAREQTDADHLATHIANASLEYGVDVDPSEIRIHKIHNHEQNFDTLTIEVPYHAVVDLSLYKPQLQFHTIATVTY
jgi:hypothetical protein